VFTFSVAKTGSVMASDWSLIC